MDTFIVHRRVRRRRANRWQLCCPAPHHHPLSMSLIARYNLNLQLTHPAGVRRCVPGGVWIMATVVMIGTVTATTIVCQHVNIVGARGSAVQAAVKPTE